MSFVTPALLGGILLVGVPIVLHLVMRREPQRLVFPALRFVQSRRAANQTRLRLRHWLLLALRCAVIALLALALARPTLQGTGKLGGKNAPIAAALVVDDSLRMEYQHRNRSRLDEAKRIAQWLIGQLPAETPIAVISRGTRSSAFAVDRGAAEIKIERMTTAAATRPLGDAIGDAIRLLSEKKDYRGEIYVFTDRAQAVWSESMLTSVREQLDALPDASLYVIDVGIEEPRNVGLVRLGLPGESIVRGTPLTLNVELTSTGAPGAEARTESSGDSHVVELYLDDGPEGSLQRRGKLVVDAAQGKLEPVRFALAGLEEGTHQGQVRLAADDPLAVDNFRYFTIEVRPPREVLLVTDRPAGALFVQEALAPSGNAGGIPSSYKCRVAPPEEVSRIALDGLDAVLLLDPGETPTVVWEGLLDFARQGGGVGVFLGRNASRGVMGQPAAAELAGGKLRWQSRDETYLRPVRFDHPILAPLADYAESVPWSLFPIFKYWEFDELAEGVQVVASYANGKPAILERTIGRGRIVMMTTPVSDEAHREPWNLLPTGPDPWPFVVLANGIADYLCGARDDRLNYAAGQTVELAAQVPADRANYVLRLPSGQAVRQAIVPGSDTLLISTTDQPGNYRLEAGGERNRLDRGFSVNAPAEISQFEQASEDAIRTALGAQRVKFARSTDEIEVQVGLGRVGRELFPWLIFGLVLVLGGEHLLANRFYRKES